MEHCLAHPVTSYPPLPMTTYTTLIPAPDLQSLIGASDPYIAGVRIGRPTASVLRVVFDLRGDVNPQVFQLLPVASFGHRLVLDLYPANPVDPLMALLEREELTVAELAAAAESVTRLLAE